MRQQYETFEQHIAAVESWLSGEHDRRASDLLKKRGFKVKKERSLSEAQLPDALRELIDVLAAEMMSQCR